MGKRGKKKDRNRRLRHDERIAEVALKKWLQAQESAHTLVKELTKGGMDEGGVLDDGENCFASGSTVAAPVNSHTRWMSEQAAKYCSEANVFILSPSLFVTYHHEADVYTTEEIAGVEWQAFSGNDGLGSITVSRQEGLEHFDKVVAAGKRMPVPDPQRWPFPVMWISLGEGPALTEGQLMSRLQPWTYQQVQYREDAPPSIIGQLWAITERGPVIWDVLEFFSGDANVTCWTTAYSPGEGWKHPYDLNPWICNAIYKHLVDFKTFIVERNWKARNAARVPGSPASVVRPPIPKPYYVVKLQTKVIEQNFRSAMPRPSRHFEYQHRFPVRGHYRIRVRRGPLPLPERDRAVLNARKYTIYTINPMSAEHVQMLAERGIQPKRGNEWLAILVSWVKDHERGPDDGPFVPSVRVA